MRWVLFICGLALVAVNFLPMWRIDLEAPQYPEGLSLLIQPDGLGGSVDIINGLNHYIGMKTLHTEDFPEFVILPILIYTLAFLFLLVALLNRVRLLHFLFVFFLLFGMVAMIDFWRWEYDYGHNLDPNAAIRVPGMAYQPPLIGYKQLLNFSAYSIPDLGGWIFISVGVLLSLAWFTEWRNQKLLKKMGNTTVMSLFIAIALMSCEPHTQPVQLGKDECAHCRMKLTEKAFAAELVTQKGKVYKFDDISCAAGFIKGDKIAYEEIFGLYFADYTQPEIWLHADSCVLFFSPEFRSPMNGNVAAFQHEKGINDLPFASSGNTLSWKQYLEEFVAP